MFLSSDDIPTLEGFARGETCSESALQSWIREVAAKAPVIEEEQEILEFDVYRQAKEYVRSLLILYSSLLRHDTYSYDIRVSFSSPTL